MEAEQLVRDIRTLRVALRENWQQVEDLALTDKERAAIRLHLSLCADDIAALLQGLDGPRPPRPKPGTDITDR